MRCNVGVNPKFLSDQHLRAETIEIPMVVGSLKFWNFQIKSDIPKNFNLGSGHMNFLKIRLLYLYRRHLEVLNEMDRRNFRHQNSKVEIDDIPEEFCNDWKPSLADSNKIRQRIIQKLLDRYHKSPTFWKYRRKTMTDNDIQAMIFNLQNGELFYV